jgi:hypothetical protein
MEVPVGGQAADRYPYRPRLQPAPRTVGQQGIDDKVNVGILHPSQVRQSHVIILAKGKSSV